MDRIWSGRLEERSALTISSSSSKALEDGVVGFGAGVRNRTRTHSRNLAAHLPRRRRTQIFLAALPFLISLENNRCRRSPSAAERL